jgi:hypothetical protein
MEEIIRMDERRNAKTVIAVARWRYQISVDGVKIDGLVKARVSSIARHGRL